MAGRRRPDIAMLLASLGIAVSLVMIVLAVNSAVVGRDAITLPTEIEQINPADGDRVLRQSRVFVDLVAGFEGVLVINGVELPVVRLDELAGVTGEAPTPGEQVVLPPVVVYDPGNATLTFQPAPGALIEEFAQGVQRASVIFWPIAEGRGAARTYHWTFSVT